MQKALTLNVNGWIRNLVDGRVEAVFEGKDRDVDFVVEFCRTGPPGAYVEHVEATEEPFVGDLTDFRIRR